MEKKRSGSLVAGIVITTIAVLAALSLFYLWTIRRGAIYRRQAMAAAADRNWELAFSYGEKADAAGEADTMNAVRYAQAEALFGEQAYDAAGKIYAGLPGYEDADRKLLACTYGLAENAERAGDAEKARELFLSVSGYRDALDRADACGYAIAERILSEGDLNDAFRRFLALGTYSDARERAADIACELTGETDPETALLYAQGYTLQETDRIEQLSERRKTVSDRRIAAGHAGALLLNEDGTVRYAGDDALVRAEVETWTNIVAVSAGYAHVLGLRADGSVVAAGDDSCGQCRTEDWTDVTKIVCGPWDSYGLRADGTLFSCGYRTGQTAVPDWTDVVALSAGEGALFAVRKNGTLLSDRTDGMRSWYDLYAVCAVGSVPVGLDANGNVLSDSDAIPDWTDVMTIDGSASLLVGLRSDGTLLYHALLPAEKALLDALAAEKDVTGISVAGAYVLLLHADGSVTSPGRPEIAAEWN